MSSNYESYSEVNNNKKILCFNMLNYGKCNYGNKCDYAHSLAEQKIEPLRHKAYTIIKCADNLKNIDLITDKKLYETLLQLTKMCTLCNKNLCPGGYNCRNGAINMKSKICYDDFTFGNCKRINCLAVHLTKKGLIPYTKQKDATNIQIIQSQHIPPLSTQLNLQISVPPLPVQDVKINENSKVQTTKQSQSTQSQFPLTFSQVLKQPSSALSSSSPSSSNNNILNKYNYTNKVQLGRKLSEDLNNIEGVLLTEKFLMAKYNKINNNDSDTDSDNSDEVESIINYLNNEEEEDSTEESIFLV